MSHPAVTRAISVPGHDMLRLIARGSYGEVWLARHESGEFRAVKVVHESTFKDKRPFEREISGVQKFEPVSRLHPGLVQILQIGRSESQGHFYCVMELADDVATGQAVEPAKYAPRTLAHVIDEAKRLPVKECLEIGITVASALEFLHTRGLVHRDVKPSNIIFVKGIPKLADIGLVVETAESASYVGTDGFIPPEGPGTVQADIYSLGKVLYEMCTGKDRYEYPELPTKLGEAPDDAGLLGLNRLVLRACRTHPRERYRSVADLRAALVALRDGEELNTQTVPFVWIHRLKQPAAVFLLVAVLALLILRLNRPGPTHAATVTARHQGPVEMPSGLVAWWRAEGDALDSTGNNPLPRLPAPGFAQGKVGRAFSFDGERDGMVVPAGKGIPAPSLTIETWVWPTDITIPRPILEMAGSNDVAMVQLWHSVWPGAVGAPGTLYALLRGHGHEVLEVTTPVGLLSSNGWSHVALTFDAETQTAFLYLNGVVVGSNASQNPIDPCCAVAICVGYRPEESCELYAGRKFAGRMDEMSIYSRALSEEEIRKITHAGDSGKQLPSAEQGSRLAGTH